MTTNGSLKCSLGPRGCGIGSRGRADQPPRGLAVEAFVLQRLREDLDSQWKDMRETAKEPGRKNGRIVGRRCGPAIPENPAENGSHRANGFAQLYIGGMLPKPASG